MYIGFVEVQHQTSCTVSPVCFFQKMTPCGAHLIVDTMT